MKKIVCLLLISIKDYLKINDRDRGAGEAGGAGPPPHFLPQTQFLTAFLGHRVTKSCKVTRTVTKFDGQIAGNGISKVSVFKISRGQSARTPLDGSRVQLSKMGPPL